jgi:hypothetical protein
MILLQDTSHLSEVQVTWNAQLRSTLGNA